MQSARKLSANLRWVVLLGAPAALFVLAGCGMPGAPQPPSLDLPERVGDFSAVRAGNEVALTWTMPKRDTDKVPLKDSVAVRVCRTEGAGPKAGSGCSVAAKFDLSPSADGAFTDTLPPALAEGAPRVLTYFVELDNRRGRSAGLSNGAQVLAGEAPAAVEGLAAEMRRDGVLLRWTAAPPEAAPVAVRLLRKLVSPPANQPAAAKSAKATITPHPEAAEQTLLVEPGPNRDRALDGSIDFGATYEYRAQRVARVNIDGKVLELAGLVSPPVRIAAVNVFPPAVPKGLAAVATEGEAGAGPAIDLNWQPNTEADLAGYCVYRRAAESDWQRISPPQPIVAPGYRDANVEPGHTYVYAVSAVDQQGHESARSAEAEETVSAP
ncbi:MAG: fibronectin type III domain-containing protein [Terracidiphilus sp.]